MGHAKGEIDIQGPHHEIIGTSFTTSSKKEPACPTGMRSLASLPAQLPQGVSDRNLGVPLRVLASSFQDLLRSTAH